MSNFVDIAVDFSSFLVGAVPQVIDGQLKWYLAGSLATTILGNAKSITEFETDSDGKVKSKSPAKVLNEDQKRKLQFFARKLGRDVDVIQFNGGFVSQRGKYGRALVREKVGNITELMTWTNQDFGTGYIDFVDDEWMSRHHISKVEMSTGEVFYMTSPAEQFAHKLSETAACIELQDEDKFDKDVRDLATMYNAFRSLYSVGEFSSRVAKELKEKPTSPINVYEPETVTSFMELIAENANTVLETLENDEGKTRIDNFLTRVCDKGIRLVEAHNNNPEIE